jgi:hypothetical protein
MKLNDLRRLTIRQRVRVRFGLSNGMECIVNEHGISRVPQLNAPGDFNLEDELALAQRFSVEPVEVGGTKGGVAKPRSLSRSELQAMTASAGATGVAPADHEE